MKIAVVAPSPVPFVLGGAERLVRGLTNAINAATPHDAELVKLPSREHNLPDLIATYRAFAELDLSHFDLVISTKYPSWMVDHPRHLVYMLHPLRGLYDQYHGDLDVDTTEPSIARLVGALRAQHQGRSSPYAIFHRWQQCLTELGRDHPSFQFPGPLSRALIHRLDALALGDDRMVAYFAISTTVAARADYFPPGVTARAVIPPSDLPGIRGGDFRGFFTASRLDHPKRIDLIVDAMAHVTKDVRLTIAGTGPVAADLRRRALGDRRIAFLGHISDNELLQHYADALAVPFVPVDEDLGYITIEAMRASKPVITCSDSGGPTELVRHGHNGFVVAPTPQAVGAVMQRLASDRSLARRLGANARKSTAPLTWSNVVEQLLGAVHSRPQDFSTPASAPSNGERPRILVLATYPAMPQRHGGQIRAFHLCAALTERYDVTYVCVDSTGAQAGTTQPLPGMTQIVIPPTPAFHDADGRYSGAVQMPVSDIITALEWTTMPLLATTIRSEARRAAIAIMEQPYLLPALRGVAPTLPFIYDAQNAEFSMKSELLAANDVGRRLAAAVEELERRAVRGAELIVTCSAGDRAELERLGPTLASWAHVPNGGDVTSTPFITAEERSTRRRQWLDRYAAVTGRRFRDVALFVASYHPPNLRAAEEVVRLAPALPDVLFVLAGAHAAHFDHWLLPPNVLARGYVSKSELRRLLGIASVALNPMASGGGSNLKLIEYFAAGVPVVSTPFGARGYDVSDPEHLRIVEIESFPAAIREILTTPDSAARVSRARAFAATKLDWSVVGDDFARAVSDVLAERVLRGAGQ